MPTQVVLIEDEEDIVELLRYNFQREGFEVASFSRGRQGLEYLRQNRADVLLLDIMLPDEDGYQICRLIRADESLRGLPIIFLTARGEEIDRILGLELGADDYVVKPFSPRELIARVRAVHRRLQRDQASDVLAIGDLSLDTKTHEVTARGRIVELSALEFRLLQVLLSNPRRIFSRDRLLEEAWGRDRHVLPRTVDVHIRHLREKLEEDPANPKYIQTLRGSGYRLSVDPDDPP